VDPKSKAPDPKGKGTDTKAKAGQQVQQPGGSAADKRQLAAAVKTSMQKLTAQQPAQRASGQQVIHPLAALICNGLQCGYQVQHFVLVCLYDPSACVPHRADAVSVATRRSRCCPKHPTRCCRSPQQRASCACTRSRQRSSLHHRTYWLLHALSQVRLIWYAACSHHQDVRCQMHVQFRRCLRRTPLLMQVWLPHHHTCHPSSGQGLALCLQVCQQTFWHAVALRRHSCDGTRVNP
jgi:hypothetical protein